uniref:Exportin-T n=2 Tax=Tetraselmis sp. GSL018 TaxID=582737 RepID=A0A061S0Z3_9CHLO
MFCRILLAIDDDVISLDIPRSQEESRRSMHLKDSMRERCIHELAEAWYQLVAMYKDQRPGLAAMVLEAVKRYICWIDIGLVANSRFMSLLFSLSGAPSSELQGAACGCIAEVLSKRMDAFHKLRLIQQLGTVEVCKSWARGVPPGTSVEDMEEELAEKYAALLATLANELLDCWKRAENGVTSIAAVGLAVDPEALQEARETTEAALGLLSELFPAIISALYNPTDSVSMAVVPFLLAYMQRVRRMQDVPERHMQHARMALDGLHACAMYPSDMPLDTADGPEGAAVVDEMEEAVTEKRREVFTLFKNVAKLSLAETASFVGARLERAIANSQASFQEVEVAVTLLYQLGEGAQEEHAKPGCGVLGQMAAGIMQAGPSLPHARNRLVAVAVLEVFVRYCRVLQTQPSLAPSVLAAVLDDRGMGHRTRAVSTRACYLFQRLVRQLRSSLAPAAEQILAGLEPHLARIAATPVAQGGPGAPAQAGAKGTQGKGPTGVASYLDDRMYAFEAAGLLLNGDDLPEDRQRAFVQGILAPLVQQVEANTERAAQGGLAEAQMVQHALAAISHLAKGFTHHVATAARPGIGELLLQVLSVVLRVPPAAPRNKGLRARVMGLLHRDVEVLGAKLLPYAPSAIAALLYDGMDARCARPPRADRLPVQEQLPWSLRGLPRARGGRRPQAPAAVMGLVRADRSVVSAAGDHGDGERGGAP